MIVLSIQFPMGIQHLLTQMMFWLLRFRKVLLKVICPVSTFGLFFLFCFVCFEVLLGSASQLILRPPKTCTSSLVDQHMPSHSVRSQVCVVDVTFMLNGTDLSLITHTLFVLLWNLILLKCAYCSPLVYRISRFTLSEQARKYICQTRILKAILGAWLHLL